MNEEMRTAASVLLERLQFMRQAGISFNGQRDLYEILGYERFISHRQYRDRYARGGIAKRIVEAFPNATWRGGWELVEDEDPKTSTEFEKAWEDLEKRLNVTAKLRRADILAGLSTYSVLLIGAPGDLETELPRVHGGDKLLYLTPFSGGGGPGLGVNMRAAAIDADCTIQAFDIDMKSERYGLPLTYQLRRVDFSTINFQRPVHWSRIIHIAEGLLDDEVYGAPTLENVWNLLDDLDKVTGGGAEAFWLRANQGLQLDIDKDMTLGPEEKAALKDQAEEYQHQIRRMLRTRGVTATPLGSDVANFNQPADAILTQIAGSKGIPKRILTGSEMGELASSQDRDNWKDQVNGRQTGYAGPYIVRPLIDRLIAYGYLPTPKEYEVSWSQIQVLTEEEKSTGAKLWADTQTAEGPVFLRDEIRDKWYGLEPLPKANLDSATGEHTAPTTGLPLTPKIDPETGLEIAAPAAPTIADDPLTGLPVEVDTKTGLPAHVTNDKMTPAQKAKAIQRTKIQRMKMQQRAAEAFSSTQVNLPDAMATQVLGVSLDIPDADLAADGREMTPHVTVKYGLHTNNINDVRAALQGVAPVTLTLGQLRYFEADAYDVLYVDVDSPDIERLNARLSRLLAVTDTQEYQPHITLAYVKSGLGARYSEWITSLIGQTVTMDAVIFSPAEGPDTVIHLIPVNAAAFDESPLLYELTAAIETNNIETLDRILGLRHAGGPGSGNHGHAGRPGELGGSAPLSADRVEFNRLKRQWAHINDDLLKMLDKPNSPEVNAKLDQMKSVVKQMYQMKLDEGGLEGIGLPGGPRDIVIIGAGPGGLSAAVMAGSDGLDTLVIDANTQVGGQAKYSSRIENYPGFPIGASGRTLAENLHEQALRVGAEEQLGTRVTGLSYDANTGLKTVTLSDGKTIEARSVVIAGGLEFRKVEFPGSDSKNVIYGDGEKLAALGAGKSVAVIGGSNGAAQAALGAARTAEHVTVISRSSIEKSMSDYQVSALRSHPKISVIEGDELHAFKPESSILTLKNGGDVKASAVGLFVGSLPKTDWLPSQIERSQGKVTVNSSLETTMPGVFAVGDIRHGSIGRIGGAVGDGQLAEHGVYDYFSNLKKIERAKKTPPLKAAASRDEMQAVWFHLVDKLFQLDKQNPFLSQTVDETPDMRVAGGAGSGNFGHAGRPGEVGGSTTGGAPYEGSEVYAPWKSSGGFEHTGIFWKQPIDPTTGRPIPIKVETVEEAVALVLDGKVVEVKDVLAAHTLINKLAEMANEAKAAGKKARDYDLCQVSVAGSNMFCAKSVRNEQYPKGIPRLEMPQLGGHPVPGSEADKLPRNPWDKSEVDGSDYFIAHLQGIGVKTSREVMPAAELKASQRELKGLTVGKMMNDTSFDPAKNPIFISSDNYVVDGHHRWAAVVGRDAADGHLGDAKMNVVRVNAPISEVLHLANAWSEKFGIQQVAGVTTQAEATGLQKN